MPMNRRAFGLAAVAFTLALTGTACSGDDAGTETLTQVKLGYIGDWNGASLLAIANEKKLWQAHGLEVKASVFTNGPLQIQALGTGDLEFGYIGPGAMWLPASGKAKVIAINTLGNADRVIAQPGITTLEGLRGKTVGVPEGTSGDMILTLALKKAGLTKSDVKIVPMDAATIVSAFASKKIDAAGFWYPATATIKKQVPDLVELAKNTDFADQVSFPTSFVAGNDVVAKDKDKVSKVLAVFREAITFRAEHPDEAAEYTAKLLNVKVEQVKADAANSSAIPLADLDKFTQDGTIVKWLTGMNDYFVSAGKLTGAVDPATYYTGDLFTAAGK
ncbi:aliphatic sulfonate ABC transporter substrate-binding protein [Catellatospora vulcania]|uniref:aliphatic sulfonate ABC transporter substrate-binding protein n=1 Tax=Catellatospora vulcania TaxID=1460450 RepID=UPI0018AFC103|nr:aliphatic sulfonate ABC transporter substrate-binding protein [Catellatospora vulcania]